MRRFFQKSPQFKNNVFIKNGDFEHFLVENQEIPQKLLQAKNDLFGINDLSSKMWPVDICGRFCTLPT